MLEKFLKSLNHKDRVRIDIKPVVISNVSYWSVTFDSYKRKRSLREDNIHINVCEPTLEDSIIKLLELLDD